MNILLEGSPFDCAKHFEMCFIYLKRNDWVNWPISLLVHKLVKVLDVVPPVIQIAWISGLVYKQYREVENRREKF